MYLLLARHSMRKSLAVLILLCFSHRGEATEVQSHGLWFERWVCDVFFEGYRPPRYTQKWDIPAEINTRHGRLPVNPKATKLGSPIGLGDALRQFDIAHGSDSFILIVGFWEQQDPTTKTWANVQVVTITPAQWQKLWHPITRAELEKLDKVIKDPALTLEEARHRAQQLKSQPPFKQALITLNPKIDRSQRRLQCSLGFHPFFDHLLPGVPRLHQDNPMLWGLRVPNVPNAVPRTLRD
jgi:hypothetical protein